jgi:hypothetical protein
MGNKLQEEEEIKQKISNLQSIIDTAYLMFDGKFTMKEIEDMPHKELLARLDNEEKLSDDLKKYKESKQMEKHLIN